MLIRYFFLFLLLISSVEAYECANLDDDLFEDCEYLNNISEDLVAGLIYQNSEIANHNFVGEYNQDINVVEKPFNTADYSEGIIKDAWVELLSVNPSIIFNEVFYVHSPLTLQSASDYRIELPEDYRDTTPRDGETCRIRYSLTDQDSEITWKADDFVIGYDQNINPSLYGEFNEISVTFDIEATYLIREYEWDRYCCRYGEDGCERHCYDCDLEDTDYETDTLSITDSQAVQFYDQEPQASFIITQDTPSFKGILEHNENTSITLSFQDSILEKNQFSYIANFTQKPYYFLQLSAFKEEDVKARNLIYNNNTITINNVEDCSLEASDFFTTQTFECQEDINNPELEPIEVEIQNRDWSLLFKIGIFGLILFIIYRLIKYFWGKRIIPIGVSLLSIPFVAADECGITNLASCIPEKIHEFIMNLLNSPLEPLLDFTKTMLEAAPATDLFISIWAIVVYIISLFYAFLFIYSGCQFLFSGHDLIRREMAKEWLKNTVIMIVLIQASFYLYGLVVEVSSILSGGLLSMVDPAFFLLTADNLVNIGLEFLFTLLYVITLLLTILFLMFRYITVAIGVIFAPIAIFCYFIPPLRSFGKFILNLLGMNIFINVLASIIILACSLLIDIELFQNVKILVMISCFSIVNLLFIIMAKFVVEKSGAVEGGEKIAQAAKYIAMIA